MIKQIQTNQSQAAAVAGAFRVGVNAMTNEQLTMSKLSHQDEQIAHSEPSNIDNWEMPRRVSSPAKSLPPPTWPREACGVGFDGQTGCRVCVDSTRVKVEKV